MHIVAEWMTTIIVHTKALPERNTTLTPIEWRLTWALFSPKEQHDTSPTTGHGIPFVHKSTHEMSEILSDDTAREKQGEYIKPLSPSAAEIRGV